MEKWKKYNVDRYTTGQFPPRISRGRGLNYSEEYLAYQKLLKEIFDKILSENTLDELDRTFFDKNVNLNWCKEKITILKREAKNISYYKIFWNSLHFGGKAFEEEALLMCGLKIYAVITNNKIVFSNGIIPIYNSDGLKDMSKTDKFLKGDLTESQITELEKLLKN